MSGKLRMLIRWLPSSADRPTPSTSASTNTTRPSHVSPAATARTWSTAGERARTRVSRNSARSARKVSAGRDNIGPVGRTCGAADWARTAVRVASARSASGSTSPSRSDSSIDWTNRTVRSVWIFTGPEPPVRLAARLVHPLDLDGQQRATAVPLDADLHRPAADLAVLDVTRIVGSQIDPRLEALAAIGALHRDELLRQEASSRRRAGLIDGFQAVQLIDAARVDARNAVLQGPQGGCRALGFAFAHPRHSTRGSCRAQGRAPVRLQAVGTLGQAIRQVRGDLGCLLEVEAMLGDQPSQERAVDAARNIVPRRDGQEGAGVIVESDGVVEPGRFRRVLTKTQHSFGTVVKPPGRPQLQARIVARQRRQLTAVASLIQGEQNQRLHVLGRTGDIAAFVASILIEKAPVVIAESAGVNLHHQAVIHAHLRHLEKHLRTEQLRFLGGRLTGDHAAEQPLASLGIQVGG